MNGAFSQYIRIRYQRFFFKFFIANASCERKSLINLVIKTSHMFIKTGIAPPLVIEVPAPKKESYVC